jgi:hypothetical protein
MKNKYIYSSIFLPLYPDSIAAAAAATLIIQDVYPTL